MNCAEIQQRLSSYFDGELPAEIHEAVRAHLERCAGCSDALVAFARLSSMARDLPTPEPPDLWPELERQLDAEVARGPEVAPAVEPAARAAPAGATAPKRRGRPWFAWQTWAGSPLRSALLVLVAVGIGYWLVHGLTGAWHHHRMATNLEEYIQTFQEDPQRAQAVLTATFPVRKIDPATAISKLPYRPAIADLPPEYSVHAVYMVEMPCCQCLQAICQRSDGTVLTIFEHEEKQALGFGKCMCTETDCDGQSVCMCMTASGNGKRLAAARWEKSGRYITVVGVRDVQEIAKLMSYMGDSTSAES